MMGNQHSYIHSQYSSTSKSVLEVYDYSTRQYQNINDYQGKANNYSNNINNTENHFNNIVSSASQKKYKSVVNS